MTKKEKVQFYRDEIVRWMNKFGLGRWSIKWEEWDTVVDQMPSFKNAAATSASDVDDRSVTFAVNPEMLDRHSDEYASRCALHEVTHVLTARLEAFTKNEDMIDADFIDEETEAIAKAMERAFFGPVDMQEVSDGT